MDMTLLLGLFGALLAAQVLCARAARRRMAWMMRPAEQWESDDVDRWLALIETFPLGEETSHPRTERGR
jgi:hypothetical protein